MSKNFQFQINKNTFKLSNKHIQTTDYRGNPITPKIKMGHAATASVVKQYVKLKYPEVVVLSSSSSFANVTPLISTYRMREVLRLMIKSLMISNSLVTSSVQVLTTVGKRVMNTKSIKEKLMVERY